MPDQPGGRWVLEELGGGDCVGRSRFWTPGDAPGGLPGFVAVELLGGGPCGLVD